MRTEAKIKRIFVAGVEQTIETLEAVDALARRIRSTPVAKTELETIVAGFRAEASHLDAMATETAKLQSSPATYDLRMEGIDQITHAQADVFRRLALEFEQLPDPVDWKAFQLAIGRAVAGYDHKHPDPVERKVAAVERLDSLAWGEE